MVPHVQLAQSFIYYGILMENQTDFMWRD